MYSIFNLFMAFLPGLLFGFGLGIYYARKKLEPLINHFSERIAELQANESENIKLAEALNKKLDELADYVNNLKNIKES